MACGDIEYVSFKNDPASSNNLVRKEATKGRHPEMSPNPSIVNSAVSFENMKRGKASDDDDEERNYMKLLHIRDW